MILDKYNRSEVIAEIVKLVILILLHCSAFALTLVRLALHTMRPATITCLRTGVEFDTG